jgi:hypothetical protein
VLANDTSVTLKARPFRIRIIIIVDRWNGIAFIDLLPPMRREQSGEGRNEDDVAAAVGPADHNVALVLGELGHVRN